MFFLVGQTKSLGLFVREKEMVVINLLKIIPQQETILTYETSLKVAFSFANFSDI